jgi:hypothetical protein
MTHQERIDYIRIILGDISTTLLPDATISLFLTRWENYFDVANKPETEPLVLWNATADCLRYLISKSVSSGNIGTERTEEIGQEQITVKGASQIDAWKDLLQYILDNPDFVDPTLGGLDNLIIIGGVRQDRYDEVKDDLNGRGPFSEEGLIPATEQEISPVNSFVYRNWPRRYR